MNEFNLTGIETARLFLRETTPDVLDYVFNTLNDHQLMRYFGYTTAEELTEQKNKFAKGLSTFNKSFHYYHLIDKINSNNIGWCGFHTWYVPHRRAEVGYELLSTQDHQKGLMSEAIKPIIAHGFTTLNLNRIEAFASPVNMASLKILKNSGFKEEGLLRGHYFKNNVFEDSAVFGLLRSEYHEIIKNNL